VIVALFMPASSGWLGWAYELWLYCTFYPRF